MPEQKQENGLSSKVYDRVSKMTGPALLQFFLTSNNLKTALKKLAVFDIANSDTTHSIKLEKEKNEFKLYFKAFGELLAIFANQPMTELQNHETFIKHIKAWNKTLGGEGELRGDDTKPGLPLNVDHVTVEGLAQYLEWIETEETPEIFYKQESSSSSAKPETIELDKWYGSSIWAPQYGFHIYALSLPLFEQKVREANAASETNNVKKTDKTPAEFLFELLQQKNKNNKPLYNFRFEAIHSSKVREQFPGMIKSFFEKMQILKNDKAKEITKLKLIAEFIKSIILAQPCKEANKRTANMIFNAALIMAGFPPMMLHDKYIAFVFNSVDQITAILQEQLEVTRKMVDQKMSFTSKAFKKQVKAALLDNLMADENYKDKPRTELDAIVKAKVPEVIAALTDYIKPCLDQNKKLFKEKSKDIMDTNVVTRAERSGTITIEERSKSESNLPKFSFPLFKPRRNSTGDVREQILKENYMSKLSLKEISPDKSDGEATEFADDDALSQNSITLSD